MAAAQRTPIGRRFAAALLPRLFGTNPRSHHKGATDRVWTGDQRLPVLCHCQLGQTIAIPGWNMGLNSMWPVARWTDGIFLRTQVLSASSQLRHKRALHPQGSPVVTQRKHCPKCHDIHSMHTLLWADWSGLSWTSILQECDSPWVGAGGLVRLTMGMNRILGDVTRHARDSYTGLRHVISTLEMLFYLHVLSERSLKLFFCAQVYNFYNTAIFKHEQKIETRR